MKSSWGSAHMRIMLGWAVAIPLTILLVWTALDMFGHVPHSEALHLEKMLKENSPSR
jgi:hypothetical protein